jgi:PAS domain S-box-containing protein
MKNTHNKSEAEILRQKAEELLKEKSEDKILELIEELAFQNEEKAKRVDELLIANKELAFRQEDLRKIASQVPGVVYQYLLRPDGTSCFPYASEAIREIYRVSPEQVREDASAVFANLHPDDLAVVAASIQASAQNLTPWQHEYRVKFSDGTIRLLYGNAVPQREVDGSVLWHGFITDITDLYSQKKALLELQKSEEKFQAIANYAASWEAWFNPEGKLVWMNSYSETLTGYTPEEYIAAEDYLSMVIAAEDIEMVLEKFQEALQGISGNDMETRINRRDGSKFWASVSWRPIFDLNGRSLGFRTSTKDISQRKKAEELLLESEEKHRILFMDSPDAYLIIIDGVFIDCNVATEVMLRGDRIRIIGQTPDALSPQFQPDGRKSAESTLQKINDTLRTGKSSFEWVHQRFDGSYFTVEVSAASMIIGLKPALFISWRDISDRKQAEETLKDREEQFRNFFVNAPVGIFHSNWDGRFLTVNPVLANMLGYSGPEELILATTNMTTQIYEDPAIRPQIMDSLRKTDGWVHYDEVKWKRKDNFIITVDMTGRKVLDSKGNFAYLEGFIEDITKRQQAEDEIKLKIEELHTINAEKDKFFSIISHDLRGPFNGFLGLTKLMAEEMPDLNQDEIQKIARSMRDSASNLFNLLENLLEWSRMQQGGIIFNPESTRLLSIINESKHPLMDSADKKGVEIKYEIPSNLEVFADQYMLASTIRNLASNAVKFTLKGGKVTIAAKSVPGHSVEISVRDTGIGMSPQMVDDLFRLDVQTNRRGTENEPSSGLGLIICKDFVEKHGGKLWVESEVDKGSTFYFTLPTKSTD